MARYTGPVCKKCRALGMKLYLKGDRCYQDKKCSFKKRSYPPGTKSTKRRAVHSLTNFAVQLREKQKAKNIYGTMERQFKRYFSIAEKKRGLTGTMLFQLLERRLDNVIYRLGFAPSRKSARQIVRHRHILLNNKIANIPSLLVNVGDIVEVKEKSKTMPDIRDAVSTTIQQAKIPGWLQSDPVKLRGTILEIPDRDKIDIPVKEQMIVEFYSR